MAKQTYDDALRRLLADEGGYSNHPSDPGGPTNFGITIIDYRKYVKPDATAADVRAMKMDEAKRIYRQKYWDALRCDELPAGVDYCVFDYGVNSVIARSGKVLRRLVELPDNSAVVTDAVLQAAVKRDPKTLIGAICDERLRFLKSLKTWPVFGNGWGRRVAEGRVAALAMADTRAQSGSAQDMIVRPSPAAPGKGAIAPNDGARKTMTGIVVAAGGAAAAQGRNASTVIVVLTVTVVIAIGVWLLWRWRRQQRQDAPTKS